MGNSERLVQLPNGDLWKGVPNIDAAPRVDTASAQSKNESADDVVAEMITSQRGEVLSCVACGQQFSRKQLNELREHVETLHKSLFDSAETANQALAMTALAAVAAQPASTKA